MSYPWAVRSLCPKSQQWLGATLNQVCGFWREWQEECVFLPGDTKTDNTWDLCFACTHVQLFPQSISSVAPFLSTTKELKTTSTITNSFFEASTLQSLTLCSKNATEKLSTYYWIPLYEINRFSQWLIHFENSNRLPCSSSKRNRKFWSKTRRPRAFFLWASALLFFRVFLMRIWLVNQLLLKFSALAIYWYLLLFQHTIHQSQYQLKSTHIELQAVVITWTIFLFF